MSNLEEFLRNNICPNCHGTILEPHQEEKFKHVYKKCKTCGFTCEIEDGKPREKITNNHS